MAFHRGLVGGLPDKLALSRHLQQVGEQVTGLPGAEQSQASMGEVGPDEFKPIRTQHSSPNGPGWTHGQMGQPEGQEHLTPPRM